MVSEASKNKRKPPYAKATMIGAAIIIFNLSMQSCEINRQYIGRVMDARTNGKIPHATISLETNGLPVVVHTDNEGVFSVPLKNEITKGRIKIDAPGYEPLTRLIDFSSVNEGVAEFRLTSLPYPPSTVEDLGKPKSSSDPEPNKEDPDLVDLAKELLSAPVIIIVIPFDVSGTGSVNRLAREMHKEKNVVIDPRDHKVTIIRIFGSNFLLSETISNKVQLIGQLKGGKKSPVVRQSRKKEYWDIETEEEKLSSTPYIRLYGWNYKKKNYELKKCFDRKRINGKIKDIARICEQQAS